jgi:hypothetical protein
MVAETMAGVWFGPVLAAQNPNDVLLLAAIVEL